MFIKYFIKFIKLFGKGQKFKLLVLTLMSAFAGFLELFGIALVYPFIMLILNPSTVSHLYNIPFAGSFFQGVSYGKIVFIVGCMIVFAFLLKNIFMIINLYFQIFVLKNWSNNITNYFMEKYLFITYHDRLKIPSKYYIFQIRPIIGMAFGAFVARVLTLLSNILVASCILLLMFIKFKFWAFLTAVFFLVSGYFQNKFFKTKGRALIAEKLEYMQKNNKYLMAALRSVKDIKIFAKEFYFFDIFKTQSRKISVIDGKMDFYSSIPPFVVEGLIIMTVVMISFGMVVSGQSDSHSVIASYAMLSAAIFRLAPIFNRIQSCMNSINSNKTPIQEVFAAYEEYAKLSDTKDYLTDEKIVLKNSIKAVNLDFKYKDRYVLKNINFEIKKGEFIGVIGASGVGKTTLADILMGLLFPTGGQILIDGEVLKLQNSPAWLNSVGYVPQSVDTFPGSIAQNIAWGVPSEEVDLNHLYKILEQAELTDFVRESGGLDEVSDTDIPPMSLGQKQRIGIARALYKKPDVIFLDEITSALDVETENKITSTLSSLKGNKTLFAIAHRISTLKRCDRIFYLKSSSELYTGTFEELSAAHSEFSNIIKLSNTAV